MQTADMVIEKRIVKRGRHGFDLHLFCIRTTNGCLQWLPTLRNCYDRSFCINGVAITSGDAEQRATDEGLFLLKKYEELKDQELRDDEDRAKGVLKCEEII